uniref:Ribbon-helix-helix protein, copG family n=1 Tax=Candidatus Kentrum sp. DK TaxID=2126562 RepID=A0A450S8Y0_9GAMM|nr:MAG: Ribbon-helix-helix protein, copG family [Candidatus Kentron sp. DK]VFJ57037.1 MAG: Ribbon-helix-helix protein, copG family [Candidatus Kentron sp. DK]
MSLSIRFEPETESLFRQHILRENTSISAFVRDAIREKRNRDAGEATPYELGKAFFGRCASGETDRSERRKVLVREGIHAKHRRR